MASFMPIGYRRLITRYESFSQVTLTAEGSLTHSTDPDDPGLLHLWDEDTSIRVSVYRLPRTIAASEAQAYLRNLAIPENVPRPPTALGGWAKDQLESFATTSLGYNEADVPEYRIVNAYAVIGNRLAAMTCTFPLDWSNEWALSIATSLNMTSD